MLKSEDESYRYYLTYLARHGEKACLKLLKEEVKNLKRNKEFKL